MPDQVAAGKDDEKQDLGLEGNSAAATLRPHAVEHHDKTEQMQHVRCESEDVHSARRRAAPAVSAQRLFTGPGGTPCQLQVATFSVFHLSRILQICRLREGHTDLVVSLRASLSLLPRRWCETSRQCHGGGAKPKRGLRKEHHGLVMQGSDFVRAGEGSGCPRDCVVRHDAAASHQAASTPDEAATDCEDRELSARTLPHSEGLNGAARRRLPGDVEGKDGKGGGQGLVARRRRRPRPDPYAKMPSFVPEIMQWAHTFLSLKFLFYALFLDKLQESVMAIVVCVVLSHLVLDRFKNADGQAIGTLTNAYFIYRMTRETGRIFSFVAAGLFIDLSFWPLHFLSLAFVSFFAIQAACEGAFFYYGVMIFWEFVVLPVVCHMRALNEGFAETSALSDTHLAWSCALLLAVTLHPLDPYTLRWREKLSLIDRRLRVPYDPVFY